MRSRASFLALTVLLWAAGAAAAAGLWFYGADFYLTDPWDRMDHPDFARFRSSGSWGHGLGIVGTIVILVNLTFLLRRHLRSFRRFGPLRAWMDMHVFSGLVGPVLIVYHSAFLPRTWMAITAAVALGILVVTGVVGRFILSMIPRSVAGAELGRGELERNLEAARAHLMEHLGEDDPVWATLDRLSRAPLHIPRTKLGCLGLLPVFMAQTWVLGLRVRRLGRSLSDRLGGTQDERAVRLDSVRELTVVRKRLHVLNVYRELMRWWRGLHRICAVIMVVAASVHVGVATYFGYLAGGGTP